MNSLTDRYLDHIVFDANHVATLRVLGEYKGKQELFNHQSPEALETLKNLAVVESTESSNRLEGIIVKRERIHAIVQKSTRPEGRSEQEVAGYRDALSLIHESWNLLPFTTNVIKQLHSIIYRYLPEEGGLWKEKENVIIDRYSDGTERIRFKPVSQEDTPRAMDLMIERYNNAILDRRDPLVVIPLVIFDFLCIHPFQDGNGRIARLLTLLLLYKAGYEVGRFISLERIFEETKESYYETLEISSRKWREEDHDIMPWLTYFWGTLIRAYKEFEERVGTITTGRGSKTEQIKLAIDRKVGPFSISDIENECPGISRDMIRHVLRTLRDDGIIRSTGIGRGAKWVKVVEGEEEGEG
ncbi:MAG: Fic family protein [Halobacteriota archaeon]|nr:Fic family protein [Halobacteriota archaeon]